MKRHHMTGNARQEVRRINATGSVSVVQFSVTVTPSTGSQKSAHSCSFNGVGVKAVSYMITGLLEERDHFTEAPNQTVCLIWSCLYPEVSRYVFRVTVSVEGRDNLPVSGAPPCFYVFRVWLCDAVMPPASRLICQSAVKNRSGCFSAAYINNGALLHFHTDGASVH